MGSSQVSPGRPALHSPNHKTACAIILGQGRVGPTDAIGYSCPATLGIYPPRWVDRPPPVFFGQWVPHSARAPPRSSVFGRVDAGRLCRMCRLPLSTGPAGPQGPCFGVANSLHCCPSSRLSAAYRDNI